MNYNDTAPPGSSRAGAKGSGVGQRPRTSGAVDEIEAGDAGELGPLTQYVGYALRRAQVAIFGDFIRTLAEVDLRPAQFSVLTVIDGNPGLLQSRAGGALGIQKANFVPLLRELERRGLVRRVPLDGRSNGLHLTAAGTRLLARARRLHDEHHGRVAALIGEPERARLMATLRRLAALANGAEDPADAPRSLSRSAGAPRRAAATRRSPPASGRA
jgi:DNA-binding MarR family transcriptional regulator